MTIRSTNHVDGAGVEIRSTSHEDGLISIYYIKYEMIIPYTLLKFNILQLDLQIMWMELVLKLDLQVMRID